MKHVNFPKMLTTAISVGGALLAANAQADRPQGARDPGYGLSESAGDGMMGGYGTGGDTMMGGYGMGPGMMDGQRHAYGMGSGMMGAYLSRSDLHLTQEQRGRIARIQDELRRKHWDLMGKIQDEQSQMNEQYIADPRDDAALGKTYHRISELRQQMFESSLAARKQMDTVLSAEQLQTMKHG